MGDVPEGAAGLEEPILRAGGVVLRRVPRDSGNEVQVLLVSRRRKPDSYTVPAGKFESDVDGGSLEACALRETVEESGADCEIISDLGWYASVSKDGSRRRTRFYSMRYIKDSRSWTEASERMRHWFPVAEAKDMLVQTPILQDLFNAVSFNLDELTRAVLAGGCQQRQDGTAKDASPYAGKEPGAKIMNRSISQASAASMSSDDSDALNGSTSPLLAKKKEHLLGLPVLDEIDADMRKDLPKEMSVEDIELLGLPLAEASLSEKSKTPPALKASPQAASKASPLAGTSSGNPPVMRKVSYEELSNVHIEDVDRGERFCFYQNQVGGHFCLVKPAPGSTSILVKSDERPRRTTEPRGEAGYLAETAKAVPVPLEVAVPAQDVVLKPLDSKEHGFYRRVLQDFPDFASFAPRIFGTKTLTHRQVSAITASVCKERTEESFLGERMRSHQFQQYIVMQDLASCMTKPCILDLKMGFKQRSKRHSSRKRERCKAKALNSTSHAVGFRVCGIHMEDCSYDKYWGRNLPLADLHGALTRFFLHARATSKEKKQLLTVILGRLEGLHRTACTMKGWRFWNTSLLFVHDAAAPSQKPDIRLIDFAHCTRVKNNTPDEEFLSSLQNLQVFLEAVREDHPYEAWIAERLIPHPSDGLDQDAEELESEVEGVDLESSAVAQASPT